MSLLKNHETLHENIRCNILETYKTHQALFHFSDDKTLQKDIERTLHRFATGTRKHYTLYKGISQTRGRAIYKILHERGIITREETREKELPRHLGPLKKKFRSYKREDKIRFSKEFYRFWFCFIYPHYDDLEKNEYNQLAEKIDEDLDYYVSHFFEELSNELIAHLYHDRIKSYGGYWDKDVEIDLFVTLEDGKQILGECKWTNHKISKNILNKLKKVTEKAGLRADYYALFSKNGFSLELEKGKDKQVLLYDLQSFKRLLDPVGKTS